MVLESFPDARLLLVGDRLRSNIDGANEYHTVVRKLIAELGISEQCTFLGNRDDVELVYPACDITVLSSLREGLPNALLESMACGIPVVTTDVSDNSYVVREGETGFLVAVGDEAKMAHRIQLLLGNIAPATRDGAKSA